MSATAVPWRRINLGLHLIGIGLLLLLSSLDRLAWSFWLDAMAFWPVVLVAIGLRMLFERSRTPALVLLSPALVLGTLTYVALRPPRAWSGEWIALRAERPEGLGDWTFAARLVRAELDVTAQDAAPGTLVEGRGGCERGRAVLRTRERRDRYRVEARNEQRSWSLLRQRQRWELRLARDLPLHVDLDLVFGRGQMDLSQAPLRRLDLDGAFNELVLRLGAPSEDVRLDINGAFNRITLVVPPATPVDVRTKGALLLVEGRERRPPGVGPGYAVSLDGFFSSVDVQAPPQTGAAGVAAALR